VGNRVKKEIKDKGHHPLTVPADKIKGFLRLSQALTACELDPVLAGTYFVRGQQAFGAQFEALINQFETLTSQVRTPAFVIRQHIFPDPTLGPIAKAILLLWYIGAIQNTSTGDWQIESADDYYRALVWDAIGAHPPTLSNGYFGHWKYPPEM